ncbi:aminoglycoside phosphotransferase family protein [Pseudoalteromonas piscicida]|uniref:phosphotransferase enzyme family protein n=1 Tax=Pseudoalteromonas piscicida TaxID=43662 RepID=UPI0030B01654
MEYQAVAKQLADEYGLISEKATMKPIGSGHINSTMLLQDTHNTMVVQKLNTTVFPNPEHLVENARAIERHLTAKALNGEYSLAIIKHVATSSGQYLVDINDEVWRALAFIGRSYSEDVVANEQQALTAANAFGQFAHALNDFDAKQLHYVIPDFHNLSMRIDAFNKVLAKDEHGRAVQCGDVIEAFQQQFTLAEELQQVQKQIPLRACHNDTKINNMLFSTQSDKARAVIDLDTCMPGNWLFDFGDMVRTFCSPEAEDSTNLDKVQVRETIFAALAKGYIEPLQDSVTEVEKESFILGAKVMPFMIGLRFLTDYLDGDNYFATHRADHNLDRAKNQFALYSSVLEKESSLSHIIRAI